MPAEPFDAEQWFKSMLTRPPDPDFLGPERRAELLAVVEAGIPGSEIFPPPPTCKTCGRESCEGTHMRPLLCACGHPPTDHEALTPPTLWIPGADEYRLLRACLRADCRCWKYSAAEVTQ
jgi:hypothetical protein